MVAQKHGHHQQESHPLQAKPEPRRQSSRRWDGADDPEVTLLTCGACSGVLYRLMGQFTICAFGTGGLLPEPPAASPDVLPRWV